MASRGRLTAVLTSLPVALLTLTGCGLEASEIDPGGQAPAETGATDDARVTEPVGDDPCLEESELPPGWPEHVRVPDGVRVVGSLVEADGSMWFSGCAEQGDAAGFLAAIEADLVQAGFEVSDVWAEEVGSGGLLDTGRLRFADEVHVGAAEVMTLSEDDETVAWVQVSMSVEEHR